MQPFSESSATTLDATLPTSPNDSTVSAAAILEQRLSKTFHRDHLRRASMALEEVIREIEEEAEDGDGDDKVLVPRSPVVHHDAHQRNGNLASGLNDSSSNSPTSPAGEYETGTAVSSDNAIATEVDGSRASPSPYPRSANTSPTPRLPGYVPGMPRPMTPRDLTFEDDVSPSNSTTPRATSPRLPGSDRASPVVPLHLASSMLSRRDSNSSRHPRASSPLTSSTQYMSRSANGRFTPEDRPRSPDDSFTDFGNPLDSSILGRRRPASPFSANTYQPMSVSSRPGTPSNVTWKKPSSPQKGYSRTEGSANGHSRSGSSVSFSDSSDRPASRSRARSGSASGHARNDSAVSTNDLHDVVSFERSMSSLSIGSGARSLRSPALPESPILEGGSSGPQSFGVLISAGQAAADNRPPSAMSGADLGSPMSFTSRALRSPTPTQYAQRSPASPTFSEPDLTINVKSAKRASRQTISSPFTLSQSNPLILSPMANSSRSSLESAGSSYHSWDAENKQDRTLPLFTALDPQQPPWHDVSDISSSSASGADGFDADDIIQQYAGLSKVDFVAIQDRLIYAAKIKAEAPETRERHNSLRKRRPSTSQSNHSINGRDSKTADPAAQAPPSRALSQDSASKASALLDSVLDSIQSPLSRALDIPADVKNGTTEMVMRSPTDTELSSPTRRRRAALADALFGATDDDENLPAADSPSKRVYESPQSAAVPSVESHRILPREAASPLSPSQTSLTSPPLPTTLPYTDQNELAKEVQRRAEAAMAQLKKMPSNPRINENGSTIQRRHVSPSQISGPKLVSASTSVDTIPLRSPSAASGPAPPGQSQNGSKLGQRFKKLRGTLRAKPTMVLGDEVSPYPLLSPPTSGPPRADPLSRPSVDRPVVASATELARFKVAVATPPASAGPGLKGFMARFLKQRPAENPDLDRRKVPQSSTSLSPSSAMYTSQQQSFAEQVRSAPPLENVSFRPHAPQSPTSPLSPGPPPTSAPAGGPTSFDSNSLKTADEDALRQLFRAASNLGLDPSAINDLLARSTSVSSRSTAALQSKHASAATSSGWTGVPENAAYGRARSPTASNGRPSLEQSTSQSPELVKKLSVRKPAARSAVAQDGNTILRRTLIFPSEARQSTAELNVPARKNSSRRRRSASATSVQSGSLHDRAPTPPPPKSPTGKRFSTDSSPPMPQFPVSLLSQAENFTNMPQPPPIPLEKSNSAYDSLYEMYTGGDGRPAISVHSDAPPAEAAHGHSPEHVSSLEPGAAVEVLEMANGETIWSIVNGLRDDDAESFYGNRASFVSEYSLRDASEGVQLFFKEHGRKASKDSNTSFLSRRKTTQGQPKRPETKVFFSSSTQIGRLIDNLSQGTDAGSFNITPSANAVSFHSESSAHWTVEERLEHMLGSLATS
ncbi:hypothetical protein BV25DRAFT_1827349 [Artomyces pyxidatus]|uniref:Uncharacterized protein n=1 Tax=Artomyces pyxidatus TaxID=48021 RepID=A0ACB8SW36_9AGAM|nr:hypothetical protein BV25DRAFT_1827349 [Artomyces pyxidatus]